MQNDMTLQLNELHRHTWGKEHGRQTLMMWDPQHWRDQGLIDGVLEQQQIFDDMQVLVRDMVVVGKIRTFSGFAFIVVVGLDPPVYWLLCYYLLGGEVIGKRERTTYLPWCSEGFIGRKVWIILYVHAKMWTIFLKLRYVSQIAWHLISGSPWISESATAFSSWPCDTTRKTMISLHLFGLGEQDWRIRGSFARLIRKLIWRHV